MNAILKSGLWVTGFELTLWLHQGGEWGKVMRVGPARGNRALGVKPRFGMDLYTRCNSNGQATRSSWGARGALVSVMWQPGGRGVGGEGIHVCVAESLCCPPKTVITLLIGYTPIQKKNNKTNLSLSTASLGLPHPSFPQALICLRSGKEPLLAWCSCRGWRYYRRKGVLSHCQNEGDRSLSVPGSGGRHKVLLLRSGAEWEPLFTSVDEGGGGRIPS